MAVTLHSTFIPVHDPEAALGFYRDALGLTVRNDVSAQGFRWVTVGAEGQDVDIVLFTEPGQELEGKNRLARIGFDRVIGYLEKPFEVMFENRDDVQVASRLTAKAFDERTAQVAGLQIVDVRNPGEVEAGAIPNAVSIPVGQLPARLGELDPTAPTVVYCAGGYRSSVAASLLRQHGFTDVSDILGGFGAWEEATQNA